MANGKCGYVLKPSYMIDEMFSPDAANVISTSCPIFLTIQVNFSFEVILTHEIDLTDF